MPPMTHITVVAPEGRLTPIHHLDGVEPGGGQLQVNHEFVRRVRYSQTTRRSIARGDLIPCDMNGTAVASVELADAPSELKDGRVPVQRKADK